MERWRKPALVLAVEWDGRDETATVIETSDGRRQVEPLITVDAETFERFRTGRMCANCHEPFEQAWPERCSMCGVPVRERQLDYLANRYRGIVVNRRRTVDEELEIIRELEERKAK